VEAPATGERLGSVPDCTVGDVDAAFERARAAGDRWADRPLAERTTTIERFGERVLDAREALVDAVVAEVGKPRRYAVEEAFDVANHAAYYAANADRHLASERRRTSLGPLTRATVHRHPVGVVGLVTPWNYPLTLTLSDALPALVAGNAVVCKPDEHAPCAALLGARLLREAGLPADAFQVVTGGAGVGEAVVDRADVVGFTGSREVGRQVAERAGTGLADASLELGGKNPMLVLEDADLGAAVEGATLGAFASAGQLCVSIERLYVDRAVYDRFLDRFVAATRDLDLVGDGWAAEVGSLASAEQLERVAAHVEDARTAGATVECGGRHRPELGPYVYEPTVLTGVTDAAALHREETFGPVVSVYPVDGADEAVARAPTTRPTG
jgi:succinate-semialdehyde dehydrogenase/glutarate-semialdehyde dehydrogenase